MLDLVEQERVTMLKQKYAESTLVVVKKDPKLKYAWHSGSSKDSVRMIVPYSYTVFDFKLRILSLLKSINHSVTDSIYLSCCGIIINCNNSTMLTAIADRYSNGGVLYMTIHGENVFG